MPETLRPRTIYPAIKRLLRPARALMPPVLAALLMQTGPGMAQTEAIKAGAPKTLPDSQAVRDAATPGRMFVPVHAPGFTDFREGLNGFVFGDLNKDGLLDLVTVTTEPFALDTMPEFTDQTGGVSRTRDPKDKLRILLNKGGFLFEPQEITITGSAATPNDISQGWRGGQVPALADFNADGLLDLYISRQAPVRGGRPIPGKRPIGSSLFLADGGLAALRDVSIATNVLNDKAYNRQPSLGDVNLDGFLDIAQGADNVVNAFEGLPISALLVFQPQDGRFDGGRFEDIGGSDLIPDFGGFYQDSTRDRAGPNIALRDIDNDGDLDLLQTNHILTVGAAPPGLPFSPMEYRHGSFSFRNMTKETGRFHFEKSTGNGFAKEGRLTYDPDKRIYVPAPGGRAPGHAHLVFGDVNNDGLLDAFSFAGTNPYGRPASNPVAARFWYNQGNFQFQEDTERSGLGVLERSYRDWYAFHGLTMPQGLSNRRLPPRQTRSQPGLEPKPFVDNPPSYSDAVFADFNNDGWLDVVVLDRLVSQTIDTRSILFMNKGDGTFEAQTTAVSGLSATGISGEAADLDNDGLVDLVISSDPDNTGVAVDPTSFESLVFKNTGANGARDNHWLRLRFSGIDSARLIGTHVEAREPETGRLIAMRGIYSNHSYKSSSALEAHFGLGPVGQVDLHIKLLGGETIRFETIAADRFLDVHVADKRLTPVNTP